MSYILDALKKSEQQRGNGKIPDVQTVHSSSLNYRDEKKAYWPYILIIAIVLNLIAIIYFIINKDSASKTIESEIETTPAVIAIENKEIKNTEPQPTTAREDIHLESSINNMTEEPAEKSSAPAQRSTTLNNTSTEVKTAVTPEKRPDNNTQKNIVEYHDIP